MSNFSCWFCKERIDENDAKAVAIGISNLWLSFGDYPAQAFYAHSYCAEEHLSAAYQFDPEGLLNEQ